MFTAGEIYDLAVRIEENGENFYRSHLDLAAGDSVRELLLHLAEDERAHREFFAGLKAAWQAEEGNSEEALDELSGSMLKEILGRRTFSLDEVKLSRVRTQAEMLEHALEFERDTIVFYEMIRGFVTDPDALRRLDRIVEEERNHVTALEEVRSSRTEPATEDA
jgi:rubrerythrin